VIIFTTGTLTHGEPVVSAVELFESPQQGVLPIAIDTKDKMLVLAGACETPSEHPLARAVVKAAAAICPEVSGCEVESFEAKVGSGVFSRLHGAWSLLGLLEKAGSTTNHQTEAADVVEIVIGSRAYIKSMGGGDLTNEQDARAKQFEEEGQTVVFVLLRYESSCHLLGFLAIADSLREEAKSTVSALHKIGVEVWMATGDNKRTALAIARRVGILHVLSEVKPEDKAAKVKQLKRGGKVVAMVGDGINDSPAIAEADVGIAIGAGSDVAIEAAAVVLMASDLRGVLVAIHLSRYVFRRIQLNMLFSLGYNTMGIPIAAGCLFPAFKVRLPPEVAALAMALSSVSVVLSSLHLKWYKPPMHEEMCLDKVHHSRSFFGAGHTGDAHLIEQENNPPKKQSSSLEASSAGSNKPKLSTSKSYELYTAHDQSVHYHIQSVIPEKITKEKAKRLSGHLFDEANFDNHADKETGTITREQFTAGCHEIKST
jgi:P-type Cu+ transporter